MSVAKPCCCWTPKLTWPFRLFATPCTETLQAKLQDWGQAGRLKNSGWWQHAWLNGSPGRWCEHRVSANGYISVQMFLKPSGWAFACVSTYGMYMCVCVYTHTHYIYTFWEELWSYRSMEENQLKGPKRPGRPVLKKIWNCLTSVRRQHMIKRSGKDSLHVQPQWEEKDNKWKWCDIIIYLYI